MIVVEVKNRRMRPKKYTFWSFCGDTFLICITGGFWIFGILIREWRYR